MQYFLFPHFLGPYGIHESNVPSLHFLVEIQQKEQQSNVENLLAIKLAIKTPERHH